MPKMISTFVVVTSGILSKTTSPPKLCDM
jgi:hypothetical protein